MSAVSVISDHSGLADGLSTMLFLMPIEDGLELIEGMEDTEALWVGLDGTLTESSGFAAYRNQ
jgi:thiamine biosynthesis lipoprotein